MDAWIPITLAAAFFQNLRSALQKHLQAGLTTFGSAYARFVFAAPFATLYCLSLGWFHGHLPTLNWSFASWAALGGVMQILATILLIAAFRHRSFAVATAYSKTETAQVALVGLILIGDTLTVPALIGIAVSVVGVMMMAGARAEGLRLRDLIRDRAALLGVASGSCFAISAVGYRAGALALSEPSAWLAAAVTLACVTWFQTFSMGAWLAVMRPGTVAAVLGAWRKTLPVGMAGMLASAGWFTAMTFESAAHVRALGQIELVFTFLVSVLWFKEKARPTEILGTVLIVGGILVLILGD